MTPGDYYESGTGWFASRDVRGDFGAWRVVGARHARTGSALRQRDLERTPRVDRMELGGRSIGSSAYDRRSGVDTCVGAVDRERDSAGAAARVHRALPPAHDPFESLLPPGGIKLTPRHYAYIKIAEGCNHRCTFCIIPSLRGRLVSRPIADVLREAEALVSAGVKELLPPKVFSKGQEEPALQT